MTSNQPRFMPAAGFECWVTWSAKPGRVVLTNGQRAEVQPGDSVRIRYIDDQSIAIVDVASGGLN